MKTFATALTLCISAAAAYAQGSGGAPAADAIFGAHPASPTRPAAETQAPAAAPAPGAAGARDVGNRLEALEKSLGMVEARLGRAMQTPSLSNNIERRLQDLEKRLAALDRNLKRMDESLRKLESRRP